MRITDSYVIESAAGEYLSSNGIWTSLRPDCCFDSADEAEACAARNAVMGYSVKHLTGVSLDDA